MLSETANQPHPNECSVTGAPYSNIMNRNNVAHPHKQLIN